MTLPSGGRIMMTTDAVGGVWVYATDLARGLCARGHEVVLVTMGPAPSADQLQTLRGVRGLSVEITDLALEWMDPDGEDWRARDVLLGTAAQFRPDVVHLNTYREAAFPWPAPVLVVAHSCVWSWWQACRGSLPDEPHWLHYASAVAAGLQGADVWAAPTRAFAAAVSERYRPQTPGRTIHNGVDLPPSIVRKEPFILSAGRLWDEGKNLAALAGIAAELEWPVRTAGPLQEPGRGLGPRLDRVAYLGVLPHADLVREMQRASIFVSPALYEPFGLSVLEAAACGCALVLSDIPSFRELWSGAALFVDPRDRQALAGALHRLSGDDTLRARMQQTARRRARRYRLAAMIDAYEEMYDRLMRPTATHARSTSSAECPA
jgi:glycosyltransferase involved in cell wall biosynthesis